MCQVVSQDNSNSYEANEIDGMIDAHYLKLMHHPRYRQCRIRVYIEANMSFIDADRVADRLRLPCFAGRIEVVRFDSKGRYGIWTTPDKKECYAMQLQISIPRARFAHGDDFLSQVDDGHKPEVFKQLKNFRREVEAPKNGASSGALHYRTHITGKSTGEKDDWAMVYGILLHHMWRDVTHNEVFLNACTQQSISPAVAQIVSAPVAAAAAVVV